MKKKGMMFDEYVGEDYAEDLYDDDSYEDDEDLDDDADELLMKAMIGQTLKRGRKKSSSRPNTKPKPDYNSMTRAEFAKMKARYHELTSKFIFDGTTIEEIKALGIAIKREEVMYNRAGFRVADTPEEGYHRICVRQRRWDMFFAILAAPFAIGMMVLVLNLPYYPVGIKNTIVYIIFACPLTWIGVMAFFIWIRIQLRKRLAASLGIGKDNPDYRIADADAKGCVAAGVITAAAGLGAGKSTIKHVSDPDKWKKI